MKLLAALALKTFEELPLEKRYQLLRQYIRYVEALLRKGETPMLFLEWFITHTGKEQP